MAREFDGKVAFITGAGLKTQEAVADSLPEPIHIQPSISSFEQALSDRGLKA